MLVGEIVGETRMEALKWSFGNSNLQFNIWCDCSLSGSFAERIVVELKTFLRDYSKYWILTDKTLEKLQHVP